MGNLAPLNEAEVKELVTTWYHKLDVHAPAEEYLQLLADGELEMRFPETTVRGQSEFQRWYEGVTRIFFDEIHTMKTLQITPKGDQADVQLVVNWQARRWNAPAPKSEWIGFDAAQRWIVRRSPQSQKPIIVTYIVDALTPMPGSPAL